MDDLTRRGNQIEALLWFVFALGFAWRGCAAGSSERARLARVLAVAFGAFGVSDVIEALTGAWWRPTWLLLLKAGCAAVFAYGLREYRRIRRAERTGAAAEPRNPETRTRSSRPGPG